MSQIRDPVFIKHGYGEAPEIMINGNLVHGVKNYIIKGAAGSLPEVTITFEAKFVVFAERTEVK